MAATKGRRMRRRDGERVLFANVGSDVIERLDAGAITTNMSRGAYLEQLIRAMPVDDRGLDIEPVTRDEVLYATAEPSRTET